MALPPLELFSLNEEATLLPGGLFDVKRTDGPLAAVFLSERSVEFGRTKHFCQEGLRR